jgi:hypothetical protein
MAAVANIQQTRVASEKVQSKNRRATLRFKVELELTYSFHGARGFASGQGRTLDVGSGGVLFKADRDMPQDGEIHLSMAWPLSLDDGVPLRLFAVGHVIRSDHGRTAVKLLRYQFRTARRETARKA